MSKEDMIELEGVVVEAMPNANFMVELDQGHKIHAHISGKLYFIVSRYQRVPSFPETVDAFIIFAGLRFGDQNSIFGFFFIICGNLCDRYTGMHHNIIARIEFVDQCC